MTEEILEVDIEEKKPVKREKVVPEADLIFNVEKANEWLAWAGKRKINAFRSARIDDDNFTPSQINFLFDMVAICIRGEYRVRNQVHRGVLYVHNKYVKHPAFSDLEKGKKVGDYIEFRKKI